jgi:aspartate/methionine/tyrosine aminotransferase
MHEFIRLSQQDEMASIHGVVRTNREVLYNDLEGTFLTPCERPYASIAWLRIDHALTGLELKQVLDEHGVFVLPGEHFFWHDREQGKHFIRVALTRDADMFREAVSVLRDVCRRIGATRAVGRKVGKSNG